ncbi:hypothetical protein KUTeg_020419 [Tegillarca granosa]|uniref:Uncharacterized protein n=1 Tax=Tegillarca granosa TaxID=220873 RepID=A0ABQ9E7Z9_TEGGR|nr:hypothetical protein KUTeg_020419 [Tegillarca granosa]
MIHKEIIIVVYLFILNIEIVSGLLCYNCDSVRLGHVICGRTSSLTSKNKTHIVECEGFCKVVTYRKGFRTYHLRMCDLKATGTGCQEITKSRDENTRFCFCKHDYCNLDLQSGNSPRVVSLASMSSGSPSGWSSLKLLYLAFGISVKHLY